MLPTRLHPLRPDSLQLAVPTRPPCPQRAKATTLPLLDVVDIRPAAIRPAAVLGCEALTLALLLPCTGRYPVWACLTPPLCLSKEVFPCKAIRRPLALHPLRSAMILAPPPTAAHHLRCRRSTSSCRLLWTRARPCKPPRKRPFNATRHQPSTQAWLQPSWHRQRLWHHGLAREYASLRCFCDEL